MADEVKFNNQKSNAMNKEVLQKIEQQLINILDDSKAYFGFVEWSEQEYCVEGNTDGLIKFASVLLKCARFDSEKETFSLNPKELKWFKDDMEIKFIKWTNSTIEEMNTIAPVSIKRFSPLQEKIFAYTITAILIYLMIAGGIFTANLLR